MVLIRRVRWAKDLCRAIKNKPPSITDRNTQLKLYERYKKSGGIMDTAESEVEAAVYTPR